MNSENEWLYSLDFDLEKRNINNTFMMILTPCFPSMNSSYQITFYTLKIIINELKYGFAVISNNIGII